MENQRQRYQWFWKSLAAALLTECIVIESYNIFGMEGPMVYLLCISAMIFPLVCGILGGTRWERAAEAGLPIGIVLVVMRSYGGRIFPGMMGLVNRGVQLWNVRYHAGLDDMNRNTVALEDTNIAYAILVLVIFIVSWEAVKKNRIEIALVILLVISLLAVVLGRMEKQSLLILVVTIPQLWLIWSAGALDKRKLLWTLLNTGLLLAVILLSGNQKVPAVARFKEDCSEGIQVLAYGRDTLPQGDLYQADQMHAEKETLRLQVEEKKGKNLYLRGYIGDRYEKGRWKELDAGTYSGKNSGMLHWLEEQKFTPEGQYYRYSQLSNLAGDPNRVHVKNLAANRKYIYTPYSARQAESWMIRKHQDKGYVTLGVIGDKAYTYTEISENNPAELIRTQTWLTNPETAEQKQYAQAENEYRSFVYENYLQQDPGLRPLIQKLFHGEEEAEPAGVYSAALHIRSIMEKVVSYQETYEKIPENEDPVRWFIMDSGEGNEALYATVAVMAFRSYQIPARYVEGYYVNSKNWSENQQILDLTSADAHAWCEVYMDGIGWVPVDTVPGKYYNTYELTELIDETEQVKATSAQVENEDQADKIVKDREEKRGNRIGEIGKKAGSVLYGLLVVLLFLLVLLLLCLTAVRIIVCRLFDRKQKTAKGSEYVKVLTRRITCLLKALGIEVKIGWGAEMTEAAIREILPEVGEGTYAGVHKILEKFYFGGLELEPYEEDQLLRFYEILTDAAAGLGWKKRIRFAVKDTWLLLSGADRRTV